MPKKYSVLVATIAGILVISSCSEKSSSPESQQTQSMQAVAFSTAIPIAEMNTLIKLTPASGQDFRNNSSMFLEVESQSQKTVGFSIDFGIQLLTYSESKSSWLKVENRVEYTSLAANTTIFLAPRGVFDPAEDLIWKRDLVFHPNASDANQPFVIRVVIQGEIYTDGRPTGERVGAYADIILQP